MNDYPIEKGVPMPPSLRRGSAGVYPWRELEPGDSFFTRRAGVKSIQSSCWKIGKTLGCQFQAHAEADGVRVWRVS
jgi:hypothetical protein